MISESHVSQLIYSVVGFAGAQLFVFVIFLVKEIYGGKKKALDDNTELTRQNTMAIQALTIELKYVHEKLEIIPELKRDLDGLGQKVREKLEN